MQKRNGWVDLLFMKTYPDGKTLNNVLTMLYLISKLEQGGKH